MTSPVITISNGGKKQQTLTLEMLWPVNVCNLLPLNLIYTFIVIVLTSFFSWMGPILEIVEQMNTKGRKHQEL